MYLVFFFTGRGFECTVPYLFFYLLASSLKAEMIVVKKYRRLVILAHLLFLEKRGQSCIDMEE